MLDKKISDKLLEFKLKFNGQPILTVSTPSIWNDSSFSIVNHIIGKTINTTNIYKFQLEFKTLIESVKISPNIELEDVYYYIDNKFACTLFDLYEEYKLSFKR